MKLLICYASTEGQTRKISRFCADQAFALGHSVEVLAAEDADPISLETFDACVLAGSVHVGAVQTGLAEFAGRHAQVLNAMPSLFLMVSLAAAGADAEDRADLDRIAARFCADAGWSPGAIHHIAGAFRFSEYDFFRSLAMRFIASRHDQPVERGKDTEFTDWSALSALLRNWLDAFAGPV